MAHMTTRNHICPNCLDVLRLCGKCGRERNPSEFSRRTTGPDERDFTCRECRAAAYAAKVKACAKVNRNKGGKRA